MLDWRGGCHDGGVQRQTPGRLSCSSVRGIECQIKGSVIGAGRVVWCGRVVSQTPTPHLQAGIPQEGHPLPLSGPGGGGQDPWGPYFDLQFESPLTSASSENASLGAHPQGRFHGNKEGDAPTCVQATDMEVIITYQPLIIYHLDSHPMPGPKG